MDKEFKWSNQKWWVKGYIWFICIMLPFIMWVEYYENKEKEDKIALREEKKEIDNKQNKNSKPNTQQMKQKKIKNRVPFYEIINVRKDYSGKVLTHIYVYAMSNNKKSFIEIGKDIKRNTDFVNYKILFYDNREHTPRQNGVMTDEQMKHWTGSLINNETNGSYNPRIVIIDRIQD